MWPSTSRFLAVLNHSALCGRGYTSCYGFALRAHLFASPSRFTTAITHKLKLDVEEEEEKEEGKEDEVTKKKQE